jgi:replicative DNA helicase
MTPSVRAGDRLAEALKAKPAQKIPSTFLSIDRITEGGFRTGDLSLIAAFEGMGKSSIAEQFALGIGMKTDVGLFSIEMGERQSLTRLGAKLARVTETTFSEQGIDLLTQAAMNARKIHVRAARDFKAPTMDHIERAIRRDRFPFWIIDHVREIDGWISGGSGGASHVGPTKIVQRFKRLAQELDIHIALCSQLSTDGLGKPAHLWKPMDTAALLHSSSLTLMLYRPFYRQGASKDTIMHVVVRKNRYGPMCTLHFRWVGPTMSLWEMTDEEKSQVACCQSSRSRTHVEDEA